MAFAITEPDAGSNSHRITTTGRRDGSDWILSGQKVWISGVDQAEAVLVVGRTEEAKTGNLRPALFVPESKRLNVLLQEFRLSRNHIVMVVDEYGGVAGLVTTLLAVGFIFTVHFFNTHLRPEKFPMDIVVFTGRMPIEELKRDKPAEYEALVAAGTLEEHLEELVRRSHELHRTTTMQLLERRRLHRCHHQRADLR